MIRGRRWQKRPITEEITKEPVKTIAQGMPVDPALTCGDCRLLFLLQAGHG
jgi:hypothetical protein